LQHGCKKWAEKRIIFGNKSEVRAAATHKKAASGFTVNLLYLDEFALVDDKIAKDFLTSVMPTVSSDSNAKIMITSTPRAKNEFYRLWDKNERKAKTGTIGPKDFLTYKIAWNEVPGRDDEWRVAEIERIGEIAFNQEYNCVAGCETVTIRNKETGKIFNIRIDDLYEIL
jgi:hypothetical protein